MLDLLLFHDVRLAKSWLLYSHMYDKTSSV
jgi:hypothetical protein